MNIDDHSEDFYSISEGGLFQRLLKKWKIEKRPWKVAIIFICVTWVPLFIFNAIEGKLYSGASLPFLKDVAVQGRILIGIPLLILIRNAVYNQVPPVLKYLADVLMLPDEREYFVNGPLQKAKKNIDSVWIDLILLIVVIIIAMSSSTGTALFADHSYAGSWVFTNENGSSDLSHAGIWMHYVSILVFQFLFARWVWQYFVWVRLLFQISKMKLNLQPTHPDNTGGLGVIQLAQKNFTLLFVVFGMVISGGMIASLMENTNLFDVIKVQVVGYVILGIFMVLFPLFFFIPKLVKTKYDGLLSLSKAGACLSNKYESEFIKLMGDEKKVAENTVDPSMQIDYFGVYQSLQVMRTVPIRISEIVIMAIMLFAPFIPIFFIKYSVGEILQKLMGLLV
jgi:hypothetical protein